MVDKNNQSLQSWNYESTVQTAVITANNSVSYEYGKYDSKESKWDVPSIENAVDQFYATNKTPIIAVPSRNFPTFKIPYQTTNCSGFHRFLGTSALNTGVGTLTVKQTGLKKSFNHRWQHSGGTNPQVINSLGCYTVGIGGVIQSGKPFQLEEEIAWGKIEDQSTLTALTTAPIHPDSDFNLFNGQPTVTLGATSLSEVFMVDFSAKQNYTTSKSADGLTQSIFLGNISEISCVLHAVFEQNQQWIDMIAKTKQSLVVRVKRNDDPTKYIDLTFGNALILKSAKSGQAFGNYYEELITFKAESLQIDFSYAHDANAFAVLYP